jgi:hypothetical protein
MGTVVTIVNSRAEAEVIVGMLRSNGIRATVSGVDQSRIYPSLEAQGVRVMVPNNKVDKARRLLGEGPEGPVKPLNAFQRFVVRLLGGTPPPT